MTEPLHGELWRELVGSPRLFPLDQSPDGQWVHFLRLAEEDYRRASFMDRRMLVEAAEQGISFKSGNVPWELLEPWTRELPIACDFIFHISHAGSTMLSRMLGEHPLCFSIREPWALRSLVAPLQKDAPRAFLALWSRVFHPGQRSMIKATSFVSQIGETLMRLSQDAKAILMHVPAETFLASVLDGSMSDIDSNAEARLARLVREDSIPPFHVPGSVSDWSSGERAAMSWLSEMKSLVTIYRLFPDRTLWVDFDAFLRDIPFHLRSTADWLGLAGHEASMLASPTAKRYAKKLDVPYDAEFRQRLLEQSRSKHREEITKGLRWLDARSNFVKLSENEGMGE